MLVDIPHDFPCLRDLTQQIALFCGAGLSFDVVPLSNELFLQQRAKAEAALGVNGSGNDLYEWADSVLQLLSARGDFAPKLRLARALGITTDPHWTGSASVDFRESKPRHRVIARMAKEGRWTAIWSFNWDSHIENALEDVGLKRREPRFRSPWEKSAYVTHITNNDIAECALQDVVAVRKPHGCVHALIDAASLESTNPILCQQIAERFMIASSELTNRPANTTDTHFFDQFNVDVAGHPTIVAAWAISEKTLRDALIASQNGMPTGRISVIDRAYGASHEEVCAAFGVEQVAAHFPVPEDGSPPTLDQYFLWIQSFYGLERIRECVPPHVRDVIDRKVDSMLKPVISSFVVDFFDTFLPVWTRLCWTAGLINCHGFEPHEIDLERPYEHVPWHVRNVDRVDLKAAGSILAAIPDSGGEWDINRFPGGFWDKVSLRLIIPIPCWEDLNDLRAFQPLAKVIQREFGYVSKLVIFPVTQDGRPTDNDLVLSIKQRLTALIRIPSFALPDSIGIVSDLS